MVLSRLFSLIMLQHQWYGLPFIFTNELKTFQFHSFANFKGKNNMQLYRQTICAVHFGSKVGYIYVHVHKILGKI